MGLADLQDALLTVVTTALEDCGRPVPDPDNVYRQWAEPAVQCCDGNGALFTFWQRAYPLGLGSPQDVGNPPGPPRLDLFLRLVRCYPTLGDRGEIPTGLDAASAGLSDDADCVYQALTDAICRQTLAAHLAGCDDLRLVDVVPRRPAGGCASLQAHLVAGWKPWG